jgi:hypothetical protein
LTVSNPGLKAVSSNASRGLTIRLFFAGDYWGFQKEGAKTHQMAPMLPLITPILLLPSHP